MRETCWLEMCPCGGRGCRSGVRSLRNYYEILEIKRDATQAEIKTAYRRLAKKYHPDNASQDPRMAERFQEIQEAYSVLSDPEKRKIYHYYGHEAYRKSYHAQHGGGFWGYASGSYEETCSEEEHCGSCGGEGHSHGDGHCGACGGEGHSHTDGHCGACDEGRKAPEEETPPPKTIRVAVFLDLEETLHEAVKDVYYTERMPGSSREQSWKFQVKIPKNTYAHQFFFLKDVIYGDDAFLKYQEQARPDKLFVIVVLLRDKPGYLVQDYHIYTDCQVDYHTLVLGGTIKVQGLEGEILAEVPAGTLPSQKIRLVGQGLVQPKKVGGRGDLYVCLHIRIPRDLTPKQRAALEAVRAAFEEAEDEI